MANHGDYDPSRGWYSANTKAWHRDPKNIGTVIPRREPTEYERQEFAESKWAGKHQFAAQPQMDSLIRLRDSDRAEDRAKFEQIAKGSTRITLHDYEAAKQTHTESDGES